MLQPVVPYSIMGLALGSLFKRPGAGAIVGSVVGIVNTTTTGTLRGPKYGSWWDVVTGADDDRKLEEWEMGKGTRSKNLTVRVRQGSYKGTPFARAPSKVATIDQAKIAAGWAYKVSKPSENKGMAARQVGLRWKSAPWASKRSVDSVLKAAYGSGISTLAKSYLLGVMGRSSSAPAQPGVFTEFTSPWKKTKKAKKSRKPTPSPRRATPGSAAPFVSSELAPEGDRPVQWYKTTKGKVAISALAGTGALILVLMFTRR